MAPNAWHWGPAFGSAHGSATRGPSADALRLSGTVGEPSRTTGGTHGFTH